MSRKLYPLLEVLCVAALIAFITFLVLSRSGGTEKPVGDVASPVLATLEKGQMTEQSNADAAKAFGFDLSKAEGLVYYENEDIMDVSELLIVKLNDAEDAESFRTAVETYIANQKNLYKNYAPEQYALLEDSILDVSGNTLFYCTAKNADALYDAFRTAL
ncbi:MAG: DUF4358 domain-containing protein [Clostridia bacterium]|jgi:hypothetical protein|nr:DUF4358 domain-containing protein [Clostridia bacterium]MBQ6526039.1 DUF4358 domain-containing protein [Clostridia bacterium]MDO4406432.1 DUF4358 domain-containing protein [Eubacteriales bacterium]